MNEHKKASNVSTVKAAGASITQALGPIGKNHRNDLWETKS